MGLLLRALLVLCLLLRGVAMSFAQTANFTFSPSSGCAPLIVSFTSTSSGATSYYWNLGNSTTVPTNNASPSTTYNSPGTYAVTLHINSPSGPSITKYVTVYPGPTVSFSYSNASGCAPLTVSFNGSSSPGVSGPVLYSWYYGDGYSGTGAASTHTYNTSGIYSVTLTATNSAGCSSSFQQSNIINVYPKPGGNFSAVPTTSCGVPATISFTNTASSGSAPYTVYWDFGDGNNSTSSNPTHTYYTGGTYTVKLVTMDARGCIDTVVKTNYITAHVPNATFTGPTDGCKPRSGRSDSLTFINTTPNSSNTTWYFGDNTTAGGDTVSHRYNDTLTYQVTMITKVGACYDTVRKNIKIHPAPKDSIIYSPIPNCGVPSTFTFSTNDPSTTSFQWNWYKGGTSSGSSPTINYTLGGVDTAYLIGTNAYGCKDTVQMPVLIHVPDAAITGPIEGCAPLTATYSASLRDTLATGPWPGTVTGMYWDFGDGYTSGSPTPTHTYNYAGTYTLVIKFTTSGGCVYYDTTLVHVGTHITPSFTATPNPVCAGQVVYFTNLTGVSPSSSVTYTWDVGDGAYTSVNNSDAIHIYNIPGTYTVKLIVDNNGCTDTIQKTNWMVVNGPNANFVDTVLCVNQHRTIHVTNQSIGATSQAWYWGDGTSDTSFSPYHTYAVGGTYNIMLTTYSSVTGCRDTIVVPVTVGPPTMNFTANDTTLCLGDTLKLYPTYAGPNATLSFYIAGLTPVNGPNPSFTYYKMNTRGYYTVTLYSYILFANNTNSTCVDTFRKVNYVVVSKPTALFKAAPPIGCLPFTAILTDTSLYAPVGIASRYWTFGNGNTATATSASIAQTYTTAGKYTVKLKVTDSSGCTDSLTKTNYIDARHPTAKFGVNFNSGCIGDNFVFTDSSSGATGLFYQWSFGDGDTSSAKNPVHIYHSAGLYSVRLIVKDSSGCADTVIHPSFIGISKPSAKLALSDTLTVCPPITVHFDASSSVSAASYAWDFGNGSTAAFAKPSSLYLSPGIYNIRLIVFDINGCPDTATAKVRVLGYAGALTYSPLAGCVPLTVNFLASLSNVPKLVWDFSDGDTMLATSNTASHTYRTPGAFVPKLVFYDSKGCSASSVGTDTIKVDAVVAGFKVVPPCERVPVVLTDTSHSYFSSLYSWQWQFGPGQIATGATTSRVYPAAGQYPVTLIVTNARGCVDTQSTNITIYPSPVITGFGDTSICPPDAVPIYATGGASYTWSPGSNLSCTNCVSPNASPTVPTSYIVTGTDSNGCANKDTVKISIQSKSTFTVTGNGEICAGQHFQLSAAGATIYHWTPEASLNDAYSAAPIATPSVTTTYIATGKEGSCAADTHMVKVVVNPLPTIDAGKDEQMIAGTSVQLQASGTGVDHIEWKANPALSCTDCYAPYASPKLTTTFYITAYTAKGCTATDSVTVHVLCDHSMLFIPNTFTPNGDALNDYFYPRGKGIDFISSFRIYSRWGELLFSRENMPVNEEYAGWNGTYKGQKLAPDVYVYIIEATCDGGEPIKWKGDVTLMR